MKISKKDMIIVMTSYLNNWGLGEGVGTKPGVGHGVGYGLPAVNKVK